MDILYVGNFSLKGFRFSFSLYQSEQLQQTEWQKCLLEGNLEAI